MLSIGEFATLGRVSVRMLRHYHALGLLVPAEVGASSGYRMYGVDQLARLERIVELKGLGLRLEDIGGVLDHDGDVVRLLERAREDQRSALAEGTARLALIEAELLRLSGAAPDRTLEVEVRAVDPVRLAALERIAEGFGHERIGPVLGPMLAEAADALDAAGLEGYGPALATYHADEAGDGGDVRITAGFVLPDGLEPAVGLDLVVLPRLDHAATTVHHGPIDGVADSWRALDRWVLRTGHTVAGPGREIYRPRVGRSRIEQEVELIRPVRPPGR